MENNKRLNATDGLKEKVKSAIFNTLVIANKDSFEYTWKYLQPILESYRSQREGVNEDWEKEFSDAATKESYDWAGDYDHTMAVACASCLHGTEWAKDWIKTNLISSLPPTPSDTIDWISVKKDLPPTNTFVDGFSKKWIDEDYNPEGVRQCFLTEEGTWTSAGWNNMQDCFTTIEDEAPTYWKQRVAALSKEKEDLEPSNGTTI